MLEMEGVVEIEQFRSLLQSLIDIVVFPYLSQVNLGHCYPHFVRGASRHIFSRPKVHASLPALN